MVILKDQILNKIFLYVSGFSSGYYSGTYALPDAIKFADTNLGSDTVGSTYVTMLK